MGEELNGWVHKVHNSGAVIFKWNQIIGECEERQRTGRHTEQTKLELAREPGN